MEMTIAANRKSRNDPFALDRVPRRVLTAYRQSFSLALREEDIGMAVVALKEFSWERMIAAVKDVRERACRAADALRRAGVPCMVIGGQAVAAWVARVDREAVRNTKDVDLLDVGLIDASWKARLPHELASRLAALMVEREREAT